MVNDEILNIRDQIVACVPECEKIYLFGSYAYGTPHKNSDYDFYIVVNDDYPEPLLPVIQRIHRTLGQTRMFTPVDVLGDYKYDFEERSRLPTLERTVVNKGVLLYDRA